MFTHFSLMGARTKVLARMNFASIGTVGPLTTWQDGLSNLNWFNTGVPPQITLDLGGT